MTLDIVIFLLEYREIDNDACDVREQVEYIHYSQSVLKHNRNTNANRVFRINSYGVALIFIHPKSFCVTASPVCGLWLGVKIGWLCPVVAGLRRDSSIECRFVVTVQGPRYFDQNDFDFLHCPLAAEQSVAGELA